MIRHLLRSRDDDNKLICRIRNDDVVAFEILYDRYKKMIYSFSFRYLQNRQETEDLVQCVFINVWEHRKSLEETLSIKSYIYRSVINSIYNIMKKRAIRNRFIEYELQRSDRFSNQTYDTVFYHDLEKSIREIVTTLPPQQQKVFYLSRNESYSYEEIAQKLDISVRTVENQIYRTIKIIRKHLGAKV